MQLLLWHGGSCFTVTPLVIPKSSKIGKSELIPNKLSQEPKSDPQMGVPGQNWKGFVENQKLKIWKTRKTLLLWHVIVTRYCDKISRNVTTTIIKETQSVTFVLAKLSWGSHFCSVCLSFKALKERKQRPNLLPKLMWFISLILNKTKTCY